MYNNPKPRYTIIDMIELKGEGWFLSLFSEFDKSNMNKDYVIDAIMSRCAFCMVTYTDSNTFAFMVKTWAKTNIDRYSRMYDMLTLNYDILHNYERKTDYTDTRKMHGSEEEKTTGERKNNGTTTITENSETQRSPYSDNAYYPYEKTTGGGGNTVNENESNTVNGNNSHEMEETFIHSEFTEGDSGVNTPQDSLQQEWRMRKELNIYSLIAGEFEHAVCMEVY